MKRTALIIILLMVMIASCFAFVACDKPSEGLSYKLTPGGDSYYLTGIGTCDDEHIVIPSTYEEKPVVIISNEAFRGCDGIVSVTIPNSITHIANDAFANCSNLKSVVFEKGSQLTTIDSHAFSGCTNLTDIKIPNEVTDIGFRAFSNCASLESISISSSVTSIGSYAFEDCAKLKSVIFEKGSQLTTIDSHAFSGCTNLTDIKIPQGVTTIANSVFSGCSALTSVSIPEGVTTINSLAFRGCTNLTSITIPSSVIGCSNAAFYECTNLANIVVDENNRIYQSIDGNLYSKDGKTLVLYAQGKTNTSFTIPSGVTSVGGSAFYSCTNLTSITIPKSLTSVSASAFTHCTALVNVIVEEDHSRYKTIDGNLYSKDGKTLILYLPGKTDTSFVIPSGVTKISSSAFENCTSLSSVTIPSSVTSIGFAAFNGCTNLSSVIFEDPDGWFVADGRIGGTSVTLTDPSKNATYLNDRYSYYTWQKY